jgi:hypothetical protein
MHSIKRGLKPKICESSKRIDETEALVQVEQLSGIGICKKSEIAERMSHKYPESRRSGFKEF